MFKKYSMALSKYNKVRQPAYITTAITTTGTGESTTVVNYYYRDFGSSSSMLENISNTCNQLQSATIVEKGANLQHRLVKFALEIDDKTKAVALLKESIEKAKKDNIALLHEENEKFEKEIQHTACKNAEAHEILLNKCDNLLAEKKSLVLQVEELFDKRKRAEDKTVEIVHNIRRQTKADIESMQTQWAAEEGDRTDKWVEQKRSAIRDMTIRGLQPQVERILDKHRIDCLELRKTFEADKSEFLELAQKKLEMNMRNNKLDATRKCDEAFSIIRSEGSINLAKSRNEAVVSLHSLREELSIERGNQRKRQLNELKAMAKSHADEIQQIRGAQSERMRDQERKWQDEREALSNTLTTEIEDLRHSWSLERERWESSIVQGLNKENERKLEYERKEINEERDDEIRSFVRQSQIKATEIEKLLQLEMDEEMSNLKVSHRQKMKESYERRDQWERKYAECAKVITRLNDERDKYEKENQIIETWIKDSSKDIAELKQKQKITERNASHKENKVTLENTHKINEINKRQNALDSEIATIKAFLDEDNRRHQSKIRELEVEHMSNLTALEDSVKVEMAAKDNIYDTVKEKVADTEVRLQHTVEIIKKYDAT